MRTLGTVAILTILAAGCGNTSSGKQTLTEISKDNPLTEEHKQLAIEMTSLVQQQTEIMRSITSAESADAKLPDLKSARGKTNAIKAKMIRIRPVPMRQDAEFKATPHGQALIDAMKDMMSEWQRIQLDGKYAAKIKSELDAIDQE